MRFLSLSVHAHACEHFFLDSTCWRRKFLGVSCICTYRRVNASALDSRFKEREAQAAQSKGLAEQVEALMQEKSTYEMVVKELSASSSQTQHDYAGAQQRLQDTVNVLARYLRFL